MLGVGWLAAAEPRVDFGAHRLSFPPDPERTPSADVPGRIDFGLDETSGRYVVELGVDGEPATFVVSTVADTTLDLGFARSRGLQLTESVGVEHGPAGAVVPVYRSVHPVVLSHPGGAIAELALPVHDTYAYRGRRTAGRCSSRGGLSRRRRLARRARHPRLRVDAVTLRTRAGD